MSSPEARKSLEQRLAALEQKHEAATEAYLNAPVDKTIAAKRMADMFASEREIAEVRRRLESDK